MPVKTPIPSPSTDTPPSLLSTLGLILDGLLTFIRKMPMAVLTRDLGGDGASHGLIASVSE
jgi:hypothetical protein